MTTTLTRCARRTFGAWLFVLVVSSLASAQGNPAKPYVAHLLTTTTSMTPLSATEVLLTYTAAGTGTHVGAYQENGSYVLDLTTFTFVGNATVTAADGSTFSFSISGGFTGPTTLAGTASITGGTGRFAGATGALAFTGVQTSPINIAADVSGWIRF
jgi:hypothetical protein